MTTSKQQMEAAKTAYDIALAEATKYADEAFEAMKMHDIVQARDTDDVFWRKAQRALTAHENWRKAAENMRQVMDSYFAKLRPE